MNGQLYKILQVSPGSDVAAIRKGYRRAALLAHPDKGGSEEQFHLVALAFETLSDDASRKIYDKVNGIASSEVLPVPCRRKRGKVSVNCSDCPMPKRLRKSYGAAVSQDATMLKTSNVNVLPVASARRTKVLARLRNVLQSFPALHRREAVLTMEPRVQKALLIYMQTLKQYGSWHSQKRLNSTKPPAGPMHEGRASYAKLHASGTQKPRIKSGVSGIHKMGEFYRASVSAANLEMYARPRPCLAMAVDDHIVLAQIRDVLRLKAEQDSNLKATVEDILLGCRRCFEENNSCEEEMQLRAKVRVRAGNWMGPIRISSAAIPLHEALALRRKLLEAKQCSWQSFRSACISVFQRMRYSHGRHLCRTRQAAEAIADRAWENAASRRHKSEAAQRRLLARAVCDVAAVLGMEERQASKEKERAEAAKQRRFQTAHRRAREELRRWSCRRDATMEDIMKGPPIVSQPNCEKS